MDNLTFISELVKSIVWPLTLLLIFAVLRAPLLALFPMLVRLRYKDLELDFGRRLEEAAAEAAALGSFSPPAMATTSDAHLLHLAEVSPRAAILEAWIRVEQAAMAAARRQNIEITSSQLRSPHQLIQMLEESQVINARQAAMFHELRGLRNSAAHAMDFRPSTAAAVEYVRLAAQLEQSLRDSTGSAPS